MKSVRNSKNTIIIKNSKFICLLYYINDDKMIDKHLQKAHEEYKDATHYCYAYILNNKVKCSDDGEPSGTAGIPMLQVLKKNDLNNVLCIVIRYFGGIKLGAGGLVRAYTKSVVKCLENSIINLDSGYNITITFDYSILKKIDYILKDIENISKKFDTNITYTLNIKKDIYNKLIKIDNCTIIINEEIYL